ncbi:hypothetical protein ACH41E_30115 [Streptomyces sp. NPDC020412]|uniref:hypothetical protein n=1 Tax=Streptomyces sp. NPDC020412 TaxID=3365073 RepID=UPI0037A22825
MAEGHYEECDGVERADGICPCDAINAEEEAYYAEPVNMVDLEDGIEMQPRW